MPPGERLVLVSADETAVFGWWRPHPSSGIKAMNGLDGWTCTIFRNTGPVLSSLLILEAELLLVSEKGSCGPSGMLTYVWDKKVKSSNPGYCFKKAGWCKPPIEIAKPRSADGKKSLLWKPFDMAGLTSSRSIPTTPLIQDIHASI